MRVGLLGFIVLLLLLITTHDSGQVIVSVVARSSVIVDRSQKRLKTKEVEVVMPDNNNLVTNVTGLDDKRVVPTGSNPLHNR